MPASSESLALAEQYRLRAAALGGVFVSEFEELWPGLAALVDPALRTAWLSLVTTLIRQWRPLLRREALTYYRAATALDTGGPPPPALVAAAAAPAVGPGLVVNTLVEVAPSIFRGPGRELSLGAADLLALETAAQATARLALDAGRSAVERVAEQDRVALGWMRVTAGDPCAWCVMLASRGPVYKSREAAGFELDPVRGEINSYHDNCRCQVVPVFTRTPLLPETTQRAQQLWETSQREAREAGELVRGTSNDALNALRRHMFKIQGGE